MKTFNKSFIKVLIIGLSIFIDTYTQAGNIDPYASSPSSGMVISHYIISLYPLEYVESLGMPPIDGAEYIAGEKVYIVNPLCYQNTKKILYIHGGAFVIGLYPGIISDLGTDLANRAGSDMYIIDYDIAPDKRSPRQLNQCYNVFSRLSDDFGAENIVVMGDSAGGNLVLALMEKLRNLGEALPGKAILISPWLDLSLLNPSIPSADQLDMMLTKWWLDRSASRYLGDNYNATILENPLVSPINMENLYELPPTFLIIGTHDLFYPDALLFNTEAELQSMDLTFVGVNGGFHIFPTFCPLLIPESNIARQQMASFIME